MHAIPIANAPCSWGTLEFEGLSGERIDAARMLDELAETGYSGTELGDWGFMPTEPGALAAELARRGLSMVGAFVPVRLKDAAAHPAGEAEALKIARLLAGAAAANRQESRPLIVLADANGVEPDRTRAAGRVRPEQGLGSRQWATFAAGAERIAAAVRDATGLETVFHHHCAGFVETPEEIAELLARTSPELLGLVFDTGHYLYGAGGREGPLIAEALERFGSRVRHVHFKDCDPAVAGAARANGWDYFEAVRRGVFCELGRGAVEFPLVADWLRRREYAGWIVVEQDVLPGMGAPRESAARNREYLRSLGL